MPKTVFVLDFGAQYGQLIARRIRELGVYCEIVPYDTPWSALSVREPAALVLSGGPESTLVDDAPQLDAAIADSGVPILGICYGMQLVARDVGAELVKLDQAEYGPATLVIVNRETPLFDGIPDESRVWMSHGDSVVSLPDGFAALASTPRCHVAAMGNNEKKIYGVQFHPEVVHTEYGRTILDNFLREVAGLGRDWKMESFLERSVDEIRDRAGNDKVICALSGGVDSSVAAMLVHKAIGAQLTCVFVNNGVLRKDEFAKVQKNLREKLGLNLVAVDAGERFLRKLAGITDPESKRKIIGREFIAVFDDEVAKLVKEHSKDSKTGSGRAIDYLVQGTLYPDVIESRSVRGPSQTIKTHHNVGGLPADMKLKLIEPLKDLFKDEVRRIGRDLGMPEEVLQRQPFPGPGLAVRILGEVTAERVKLLQEADDIVVSEIKAAGLYTKIWQSFAVLLPVMSVGVMGDQRTYAYTCAIRAVHSEDGMTADVTELPWDVLKKISSRIVNEIEGINRVVYDVTSKPPGTIEWE
jgi:GMP synthase (glutamine-hydrolysing)